MDNEKFQEFMADQFAKMFQEFQGLKSDVQGLNGNFDGLRGEFKELKDSQVRMEDKFDKQLVRLENKFGEQLKSLHDFRVDQDNITKDNVDAHTTFNTKIEELQFDARITARKLDEIAVDLVR